MAVAEQHLHSVKAFSLSCCIIPTMSGSEHTSNSWTPADQRGAWCHLMSYSTINWVGWVGAACCLEVCWSSVCWWINVWLTFCHLWGFISLWFFVLIGWVFFPSPSRLLILTHHFFLTFAFSFLSLVPLGWEMSKRLGGSLAAGQIQATTWVAVVKIWFFFSFFFSIHISNTYYEFLELFSEYQ